MGMQTQFSADQIPADPAAKLSLTSERDAQLTQHQMAQLDEVWLEPQANLLGEIQGRGVPYSPLNG
jgi:hypothetical protein